MSKEDQGELATLLSPEELAAISDDTDSADLDAVIGDEVDDHVDGDDDTTDTDDDAGETDEPGAGAEDTAAAEAAAAEAAAGSETTDDDGVTSEFVPQSEARPVENYDQRMQEFASQKAELRSKLNNGDIDIEQYETQKDQITEQETELKLTQRDYENAVKREQQTARQKWDWEQEQFFEAEANKVYRENSLRATAMNAALNAKVIELAKDPANGKRSGSWFLQEADRQVREAMGMTTGKQQEQQRRQRPNLGEIPPNLGNLPAAEQTETGDNEFAYLDKLEGVALEQELAKISRDPAREARYLRQ